jgi:hypothetical protein
MFDVGYFPPNTPPDELSGGRYTPNTGHSVAAQRTPLWANRVISHRRKTTSFFADGPP